MAKKPNNTNEVIIIDHQHTEVPVLKISREKSHSRLRDEVYKQGYQPSKFQQKHRLPFWDLKGQQAPMRVASPIDLRGNRGIGQYRASDRKTANEDIASQNYCGFPEGGCSDEAQKKREHALFNGQNQTVTKELDEQRNLATAQISKARRKSNGKFHENAPSSRYRKMSFHESEMSRSVTQNSEISSCEFGSSFGEGSCAGSEDGEAGCDNDGRSDGNMDSRESEQDIDASDKASSKDEKDDGFNDFMQLIEPDEDISGSFVCSGDSDTSVLGRKIKFYPKIVNQQQPKPEEHKVNTLHSEDDVDMDAASADSKLPDLVVEEVVEEAMQKAKSDEPKPSRKVRSDLQDASPTLGKRRRSENEGLEAHWQNLLEEGLDCDSSQSSLGLQKKRRIDVNQKKWTCSFAPTSKKQQPSTSTEIESSVPLVSKEPPLVRSQPVQHKPHLSKSAEACAEEPPRGCLFDKSNSCEEPRPSVQKLQAPCQQDPTECLKLFKTGHSSLSFIRSQLSPVEQTLADLPFDKVKEKGQQFAQKFGGTCISESRFSIVKGQQALKFKCKNGHQLYKFVSDLQDRIHRRTSIATTASTRNDLSDDSMSNDNSHSYSRADDTWCSKCATVFRSYQLIGEACGFELVGKLYSDDLAFRCTAQGHISKIRDCSKKLPQARISCAECRKDKRQAQRRQQEEEEMKMQAIYAQKQEEMFRKAREQMEKEMRENPNGVSGSQSRCDQAFYAQEQSVRFQAMETEVNQKASHLTKVYLRDLPAASLTSPEKMQKIKEQTYLVYKFIHSPIEMLASGMSQKDPNQLTQFYRKLAKQLHPDKNDHPQAKEAFQRVQQAVESAKKSWPVSSARFSGY